MALPLHLSYYSYILQLDAPTYSTLVYLRCGVRDVRLPFQAIYRTKFSA